MPVVENQDRMAVAQAMVLAGVQTEAAIQLMMTSLAKYMRPECQQLALQVRKQGIPPMALVTNPDLAKLPLVDRLRSVLGAVPPLVTRSLDGRGDYSYAVGSGSKPLPESVSKELRLRAEGLRPRQDAYTKALLKHQSVKSEVFGGKMSKNAESLAQYSEAALGLQGARNSYYAHVREYLASRASLAKRGFDVAQADAIVRMDQSLNPFLRDCLKAVHVKAPEHGGIVASRKKSMSMKGPN